MMLLWKNVQISRRRKKVTEEGEQKRDLRPCMMLISSRADLLRDLGS